MARARIRIDETPAVCLVYCSCGWRELTATKSGAWRAGAWHETAVHPESRSARETWARRERADDDDDI